MEIRITDKELNNYELESFDDEYGNPINFEDIKKVIDNFLDDDHPCDEDFDKYGQNLYDAVEYYEKELKLARVQLEKTIRLLNGLS